MNRVVYCKCGILIAIAIACMMTAFRVDAMPPASSKGVCYCNLSNLSDEAVQRLLKAPEVVYLMCQESVGGTGPKSAERARILTAAGKKIILQLWYGPGGRYNWSYHSYPALALDPDAQKDFFEGVDKTIDALGAENVYAVHVLEEDGWFGVMVDIPGDWRLDREGLMPGNSWDDGDCYSNYRYAQDAGHLPWSEWTPSVRRFADVFKRDTGLDMRLSAWQLFDYHVLDRWMGRRLWAGAHIAVARHLRAKYPHIRNYVWGYGAWSAEPFQSDGPALRDEMDGIVQDPYGTPYSNYVTLRVALTHLKEPENVCLLWGTTNRLFKAARLASGYISGAHGLGFFEDGGGPDVEQPERWAMNLDLHQRFAALPFFTAQRHVFYTFANDANGPINGYLELPLFQYPEVSTAKECYDCEIERYDVILLHETALSDHADYWHKYNLPGPGLDRERIKTWVKNGGVLAMLHTGPDFLLNEGWVIKGSNIVAMTNTTEVITPHPAQQKLGLLPSYKLHIPELGQYQPAAKEGIYALPVGVLVRYGKGAIYYEPDRPAFTAQAVALMPPYHADVLRGALGLIGKSKVAEEAIIPRAQMATPYYHALSADGKVEFWLQFDEPRNTGLVTRGRDIITGETDVPLDAAHPAVIILNK